MWLFLLKKIPLANIAIFSFYFVTPLYIYNIYGPRVYLQYLHHTGLQILRLESKTFSVETHHIKIKVEVPWALCRGVTAGEGASVSCPPSLKHACHEIFLF